MTAPAVSLTTPPEEPDPPTAEILTVLLLGMSAAETIQALSTLTQSPATVAAAFLKLVPLAKLRLFIAGANLPRTGVRAVMRRHESTLLATHVYRSIRRMTSRLDDHLPVPQVLSQERRYWEQYVHARNNRHQVAAVVEEQVHRHGLTLGWHATLDALTSDDCRVAHGCNFDATKIPLVGWPGAAHPTCRCRPGKPWPRGAMLESL